MHRLLRLGALGALGLSLVAGCTSAGAVEASPSEAGMTPAPSSTADASLVDIGAGLQGPAGATASVIATGLVNVAAFAIDDDGRLWAGTAAYADDGSDVVALLDPDDAAVSPRTVITGLHTVLGLVWSGDTLYVASAGRIDAFTDFDGSTFAGRRTVIAFPAGTGEVNGLALAPDGRLRVGISAPCDDCAVTDAWSGSIVSVGTDGSDPRVETSGIRAPVGLAYLPGTDDLFVTMNQRDDLGDATPGDWLSVVRTGQDWGFPACYGQGGEACDTAPLPAAVLDPHAAVSGVALAPDGLPTTADPAASIDTGAGPATADRDASGPVAFVAEWTRGLVLRVDLIETDGTWTGTPTPFLSGVANPVAVAIDGAGALIVGDWTGGTIYRVTLG